MTELSDTQRKFVEMAVEQTLLRLGLDVSTPESVIAMQKDFQHLRRLRLAMVMVEGRAAITVIGTIVAGTLAAVFLGLKQLLTGHT